MKLHTPQLQYYCINDSELKLPLKFLMRSASALCNGAGVGFSLFIIRSVRSITLNLRTCLVK